MTSKISYSKFIKENIRHRGWLAALSSILLLLGGTISTIMLLESSFSSYTDMDRDNQMRLIRNLFPALLNGGYNLIMVVLILLLGVLTAVTGFAYLHSKEKTDFYHSLPLSRKQLFFISYLGGLLIFAVPYLIASLLTILAGFAYGVMTISVLGRSCVAILGGILAFLLVYHLTVFAMMLTGKIVTGILAAATLSVYATMAGNLGGNLMNYFCSTYSTNNVGLPEKISRFWSPTEVFGQLLGSTSCWIEDESVNAYSYFIRRLFRADATTLPAVLTAAVVLLIVLFILSVLLYQKRPSEAAGNALVYPGTAPFIKVMISIPTALFLGLLIGSMYSVGTKWIILISLLSVILLCALIEFIYHMDLRRLFAGKYSSLLSFLGVAGILCILQFDLFGYDTWLPKESSLESMALDISQVNGYFCYPDRIVYNAMNASNPDLLEDEDSQISDFSPIYELAQKGVENHRTGLDKNGGDDCVNISIRYNKKSGKSVYRRYVVREEQALDTLTALCREESYRKKLFSIFYVDDDMVSGIQLRDIYWEPEVLKLTRAEQKALLDAYRQDALNAEIRDLEYEIPIGELSLEIPEEMQSGAPAAYTGFHVTVSNFFLYESYENSLDLLKKYGYTIRREIDPKDVAEIKWSELSYKDTVDAYGNSIWTDESTESLITDPGEIQEVLSQLQYTTTRLLGTENTTYSRSVEILFKDSEDFSYYPLP